MLLGMGNKGQPKYERDMLRFFSKFTFAVEEMDNDTEYTDTRQGVLRAAVVSWAQPRQEGWENDVCYKGPIWRKHRFSTAKCNICFIYLLLRCFPRVPGWNEGQRKAPGAVWLGTSGNRSNRPSISEGTDTWLRGTDTGHRLYRHKMEGHWYQGLYLKIPEDGEVHGFFFLSSRHCLSGNASIGHAHQHLTRDRWQSVSGPSAKHNPKCFNKSQFRLSDDSPSHPFDKDKNRPKRTDWFRMDWL